MPKSSARSYIAFVTTANLLVALMVYILNLPLPTFVAVDSYASAFTKPEKKQKAIHSDTPERLVIPSLDLNLAVKPGAFDARSGTWTDNGLNASYANSSVPVNNNNGTTVIYAHAQWGAFAALPSIKLGATAKVYGSSGQTYTYVAKKTQEVAPNDTSIFRSSGSPRLVLQTCSGPWDVYRMLVYFDFVGVKA